MTIQYTGTINFLRQLTEQELELIKNEIEISADSYMSAKGVDLYDCWEIHDEITDWLKERGNDVVEGTVIDYWGDYSGAERYENGEWVAYDDIAICSVGDDQLFAELKYRGYDVFIK